MRPRWSRVGSDHPGQLLGTATAVPDGLDRDVVPNALIDPWLVTPVNRPVNQAGSAAMAAIGGLTDFHSGVPGRAQLPGAPSASRRIWAMAC